VEKFLLTWADRANKASEYALNVQSSLSIDKENPNVLTLALSRRLIAGVKVKNIVNIEAGLDMIALAMSISSQVSCI
jgi:hypothetical protein